MAKRILTGTPMPAWATDGSALAGVSLTYWGVADYASLEVKSAEFLVNTSWHQKTFEIHRWEGGFDLIIRDNVDNESVSFQMLSAADAFRLFDAIEKFADDKES